MTIERGREIFSRCLEGEIDPKDPEVEELEQAVKRNSFAASVGEPFGLPYNKVQGGLGGFILGLGVKEVLQK